MGEFSILSAPGRALSQSFLPVIIVEDNETAVTTSEGDLVALIVPPVGLRLSIDHITENGHVPKSKTRQIMIATCNVPHFQIHLTKQRQTKKGALCGLVSLLAV